MTTGTAEVIKVEDLEEIFSNRRKCEVKEPPKPGTQCKRDADLLIRYRCDCFSDPGTTHQAWLCRPHYTWLRYSNPEMVAFTCSFCGTQIRDFREL